MSAPKHSALFRDSLGGITIRHYIRQALFAELRKAGFSAEALAPKEASQ